MKGAGLVRRKADRVFDFIIKYELLLLAAAIPVLVLPRSYLWKWQQGLTAYAPLGDEAAPGLSPLTWVALGLVALPWLLRLVRQAQFSQRTPLDWPIALTLLSAAIGLWPSVDPLFSLERFLGLVAGVALYYGLVNSINTERQLGWLLALFLAGGAALALLGFAQTDWTTVNSPLTTVLAPVYGALARLPKLGPKRLNVSVLAGTLIIFVPLALCLLLAPIRRHYKPFLALVALLAGSYAVLGWSRGDLLALALALLLLPAFVSRRYRILLLTITILAFLTLTILLVFQPSNLQSPISNLQSPISNLQSPISNLLTQLRPSRWQVWTRALLMIRDYPFTGIGLDTFRLVAQNEYPYFNYALNQTEHAHNLFLQAGVDGGVLGLAALMWMVVAFYRTNAHIAYRISHIAYRISHIAIRNSQLAGESQDQSLISDHWSLITDHWSLVTGLSAGFTAFLISSLFDNGVMSGPRTALVVWAVLGLQVAGCKSHIANRISHIAYRKSHIANRNSRITHHASRITHHALLATAGVILLLVVGYLSYPIVASAYYDNLGVAERGRGWLWREASEEQRRAYARSALAHFQQALALWPGNAAAQRHLGTLYFHAQHPEEAVARLQGMPGAGYHPGFLAFYDEVAKVMGAEAPLPHISINSMRRLEQAVALAPYDFLARFFLAEAYRADGRVAEAADQYAAAGVPLAWVLQEAGRRCQSNPSIEGAMVEYEIAARLSPASPLPGYGRGDCLRGRGSNDEAMAAYRQAIALDNDNSLRKHVTLGWIYTYQQEWGRAIAAYQRAVALAPDNAWYHAILAEALVQQSEGGRAIVEYEHAARLDPRNASYQVRLGDLYRDAGRAADARAAYQAALALRPDDEYVKGQLAQLP